MLSIIIKYFPVIIATTNFVGKFTQSVRRIVQDVKDEGAPSGMTRDEVIETNERLRSLRLRLEESYDTVKKALINLMNKYGDSKSHRNIFQRYPMLKLMIKVRNLFCLPHQVLMLYIYIFLLGSNTPGDSVLDVGRHSATGETGNGTLIRNASLFNYGKDPEVRRGRKDIGSAGRGGRRAPGADGAFRT